jgi:hypothetical protein
MECLLFGFLSGAACLSLATFVLCLIHQARAGIFLAGGAAAAIAAIWSFRNDRRREALPTASRAFSIPFWGAYAVLMGMYTVQGLAPEISPDGSGYHLGNVVRLQQQHGFDWAYHSLYSYFPQGMEMLFLPAFLFGRHSAAALVHVAFLGALPLMLMCFGRRFGFPGAGYFAGLVVLASPVVGKVGVSAYNDVAVAAAVFGVFYLAEIGSAAGAGLLAGFAFALKYTGGLALPFGLLMAPPRTARRVAAFALPAAATVSAWMIRDWVWVGNPLAPFFNRWFPNAFFHPGSEEAYKEGLAHFEIPHWQQIPLDITIFGRYIPGMLGAVFLLAPFGLIALRYRLGRRVLLAAAVFALPVYFNASTRFLIPALPFAALAMGMAAAENRVLLPAVSVAAAVLAWPPVLAKYSAPWAWRLREIPKKVVRGREPADRYILRYLPDYGLKDAIEREVPPGGRIFSFAGRPEAYIGREIVVGYESTAGERLQDALWTLIDHPPVSRVRWDFPAVIADGVRITLNESAKSYWTVADVRVSSGGKAVGCSRFGAAPNLWEAALAFDGNPATRWSTWDARVAGNHVDCGFASPQPIDEVTMWSGAETRGPVRLEVLTGGKWTVLTVTSEESRDPVPDGLRAAAARVLLAAGVEYLWINDGDLIAQDLKNNAALWKARVVAEGDGSRIYRIGE